MKRREMKLLLEERFERIALLETRIDTLDQLVEGFRAREQSIFNTLQATKANAANALEEAKAEGAKIIAEAEAVRAEAEKIRNDARVEAEALLSQAITTANTLKAEAERKGNELTAGIRAESERMLKDAEIIKREYEEMVETFNGILEQNASELEVTATRFAEFVKNRRIDRSEARLDGDAFYKSVGEMNDTTLPDASENPALLMQNIYRIQNRPLPEDRQETPAPVQEAAMQPEAQPEQNAQQDETAAQKTVYSMEVGADAVEADTADKPFSEQAWANEALKSESEPQAEFVRPFDPDYTPSDYTIHHDACLVTQEDAESAFDALVPDAGVNASVALPLGSAAVAAGMGEKPMEETVRKVDEYFDSAIEPDAKAAQDVESAAMPEPYSEQAWAQSETLSELEPQAEGTLFTQVNDIAQEAAQTPVPETLAEKSAETEAPAMPEPYSEQAWEQSETLSELEPQAEGTLFTQVNEIAQEAAQTPTPEAPAEAAYTPEQPIPTVEKPVSTADMASALDDYFDEIDVSAPTLPQTPTTRASGTPDPYSENAWEQTNLASDVEPQAEGQLFAELNSMLPDFVPASAELAGQFVPTAFGIVEVKQPVTSNEAEHAFDSYLSKMDAGEPAGAPDPYSEQAWKQNDFASVHEAQAEGGLFNDVNAFEPAFTPAAGAPVAPVHAVSEQETEPARGNVTASDAVNVFDSYLEQMEPFAPTVPQAPEEAPAAAPEPYSAEAWAYTPNVSEYEPQAEGDSIISATLDETLGVPETAQEPFSYVAAACIDEPEEEEEPEPTPAPRKYNEYGEIREWEPEPEPDMGDIPTVSRFMGASGSDEISLDELLDEIIKAGE